MLILKNFSKPIRFTLHIAALTLLVISAILLISKEFLIGNSAMINSFEIYTRQPVEYTLFGTINFSNIFVEYSGKHTQVNAIIKYSEELILAAKMLKVYSIAIVVIYGLTAISQLFNFRTIASIIGSLLLILSLTLLYSCAINNFEVTKMITGYLNPYKNVIILLSIGSFLLLLELLIDVITSKRFAK